MISFKTTESEGKIENMNVEKEFGINISYFIV